MIPDTIIRNAVKLVKTHRIWLLIALIALVPASLTAGLSVELSDFQLRRIPGNWRAIDMPLSGPSGQTGTFEVRGTIVFDRWASRVLHITPDDEVERIAINGRRVDLSGVPAEKRRDWQNGFRLDVGSYVTAGRNSIEITFRDIGGNIGMDISPAYDKAFTAAILALWLIPVLLGSIALRSRINLPRRHTALYCLVLLGAALQVWTLYAYNPMDHVWSDPQRHWEQGTEPLRNDMMSNTDPVMYQLYIGALAKLSLGMPGLVAFYTCLLALIAPWFWYRFLRELQDNKTAALAGWAVFSLLPSWLSIYSYFMQETLMLALLGAALWATWRARRKQTLNAFLVMVLLWAAAGLTRGICIPLAAVAVTWLWVIQGGKVGKALGGAAILGLILGPLTYRSLQAVGIPAPHGIGQMNMIYAQSGKRRIEIDFSRDGARWTYIFQSPAAEAKPLEPLSDWQSSREGTVRVRVDARRGSTDWEKGLEKTSMDLKKYLRLTADNLVLLFFSESWPDSNRHYLPGAINYHMRWIWAPLALACIVAVATSRRIRRHPMLPVLILTWFVVQGLLPLAVNEGRYRKPFEGLAIAQMVMLFGAPRSPGTAGARQAGTAGPSLPQPARAYRPAAHRRRGRYRRHRVGRAARPR